LLMEHFGIMDTPEYQKNAVDKVSLYMRHGIYPQDRLIITYETKEHPLDTNHSELPIV
jgi:membrane-anchored protein YejM (alkaline phosphatase superfamily)